MGLLAALLIVALATTPAEHAFAQASGASTKPTLGSEEPVLIYDKERPDEKIEVLAKIDTGASTSSIDEDLAEDLGFDLENPPDTVTVQSALGEEERPVVPITMDVAGETIETRVPVSDRSDLSTDMLVGSEDVGRFQIDVSREQLTTPKSPEIGSKVDSLLEFPPPTTRPATLLAALPLAAALVVALRTLVGVVTFGLFAPVLLAVSFVQVGLPVGFALFGCMMLVGLVAQPLLKPLKLPRIARLSLILTFAAVVLLGANYFVDDPSVNNAWAGAFPVVVISVIIERFWDMWEQEGIGDALKTGFLTLLVAILACVLLVNEPVLWASRNVPLALALLGGILSLLAGRYKGLRLSELVRFRPAAVGTEKS